MTALFKWWYPEATVQGRIIANGGGVGTVLGPASFGVFTCGNKS